MEEPEKGSQSADDRSKKTGEALRALREGLGMKLAGHRRRTGETDPKPIHSSSETPARPLKPPTHEATAARLPEEDELHKLRQQLAERDATVNRLERQLSDSELAHLRLSAELTESRSAIGVVRSQECTDCVRLRSELATANERLGATDSIVRKINEELDQLRRELEESQQVAEMTQLRDEECGRLHAELAASNERLEDKCATEEKLLAELGGLRLKLSDSQRSLETLQEESQLQLDNSQAALSQIHVELESSRRIRESLDTELTGVRQELDDAHRTVESLRQGSDEQCRRLHEELASIKEQLGRSQDNEKLLETQLQQAERESAELQKSLDAHQHESQEQSASLEQELTNCRQDLASSRSACEELQSQLAQTQQELAEVQQSAVSTCQKGEEEATRLKEELSACNLREAQANETISGLQSHVEQLTSEVDEGEKREARANETIARLEAEVEELTSKAVQREQRESQDAQTASELLSQIEQLTSDVATAREAESQLRDRYDELSAALAESNRVYQQTRLSLDAKQAELEAAAECQSQWVVREEDLLAEVQKLTQDLAELRHAQSQLHDEHTAHDAALVESRLAAEDAQQQFSIQLSGVVAERDALAEDLTHVQAELLAQEEATASELSWLEKEVEAAEQSRRQLATEFEELLKQHKSTEQSLETVELQNAQAIERLREAEEKILQLTHSTEHEEELIQMRRKFELALTDAQRLKRDNAALQDELAKRPAKAETESPELVSLRVERDALAVRVAELEAAPAPTVDEHAEQRTADLQRRFELAVEDLRDLKQENASLQEKLANSSRASTPSSNQPMDWQAQKARLLAALESEDESEQSAERRQELATIEGTISITDRVVAEKDREIAALNKLLAETATEADKPAIETGILEKDEIIAAERAKLQQLQQEWHEKLRSAELEISVQRAALARKEAQVEQKLQEVQLVQGDNAVDSDGKPKRRWLSALGLRDEDEKK